MNERREPTIAPLSSANPASGSSGQSKAQPQSQPQPQQTRAQPSKAPVRKPAPVSGRQSVAPASRKKSSSRGPSLLSVFAFVIAVGGCVGAGFIYSQLMQTQVLLQGAVKQLEQSDKRIGHLESQLELSGDESVQSMAALQSNIKTNTSEVKKLWAVAYDRNRKTIADNKASIAKLVKTYKSGDGKVSKALAALGADVSVLNELMDAQQGVLSQVDKVSQSQKSALATLSGKLGTLDKTLGKKIRSNEEAIKAIDAFRLQVNRSLIQLKGG